MRMRTRPYCIRVLLGIMVLLLGTLPLFAQKSKAKGPRAVAVVRWQLDPQGSAHPFLIPVAILVENKIYDAGLYRPAPRPFALESGTLYEAQDKGELLGFFTVENAIRGKGAASSWIGLGKWKSEAPGLEYNPAAAASKDDRPQAHPAIATAQVPEDGTPTNKKKKVVYDEQGRPIENPDPADDEPARDKSGRPEPVSRLPQVAKNPKPPETTTTSPQDDPDRPRLKRGPPTPSAPVPAPASTSKPSTSAAPESPAANAPTDVDPDRPVLKRGKPAAGQTNAASTSDSAPVPFRVQQRGAQAGVSGKIYDVVAISDADTSSPPKDYRFRASEDERQELQAKMQTLAQQAISAYEKNGASAAKPARKSAAPLEDVRFEMFDLDANNSAELVFSARQRFTSHVSFVTIVARTDINGNPRPLLSHVTTDQALDAKPRLDLVDAVDLTNDGPAELLFRQTSTDGSDFIIYRVGVDHLEPLFRGAGAD